MKYTVIYEVRWQSGSHTIQSTRFKRIEVQENETVIAALERKGIVDTTIYIFEGWSKLIGE